jgi:DNA-binding CsgD family transcriptional regulator
MTQRLTSLTEKEKQTLRLLVIGHDAKSIARHFGLSVHTVNERLRDVRRKLAVSSSREAARLLHDAEVSTPHLVGDATLGDVARAEVGEEETASLPAAPRWRGAGWRIGGIAMFSMILSVFALSAPSTPFDARREATAPTTPIAETEITQSARRWLQMVDAARWQDSWQATGRTFRDLNTVDRWEAASQRARVPLGAALSRTLVSSELTPTPPAGNMVVKFRTRFAARADAVETIALVREDDAWKVVGYFID